jgi:hypothetical protein
MQTVGPFRVVEVIGTCDVGEVWSAVDAAGERVTVAVLTGAAAADQPWRDAFAATAYALSGAGDDGLPIVTADYTAVEPWVACADEPGPGAAQIFMALGMPVSPATPASAASPAALDQPTEQLPPQPHPPAETAPAETVVPAQAAAPAAETRASAETAPAAQAGTPGGQPSTSVSGPAAPEAPEEAATQPVAAKPTPNLDPPTQMLPPVEAAPAEPPRSPTSLELARRDAAWLREQEPVSGVPLSPYATGMLAARPPGRRMGLWLAVVAVVALALGVAGGALGSSIGGGGDKPVANPTPTENLDLGLPSAPPAQPGVEPPQGGGWPEGWPDFGSADDTRNMSNLSGLGFSFEVPEGWDCIQAARGSGYVHYTCGRLPEIGGDLIVRQCPKPCTDDRRIEMRTGEEAWGVRWTRSGPFTTWGETRQVNGAARYGLVYVGYWRSTPEDAIDRQLVFRMTSPLNQADQLRKVISSIREVTFTI